MSKDVTIDATNGFVGGTYYVLASTNIVAPLNKWLPVATNVPDASGNLTVTVTNALASHLPQEFYILRVQ